MRFVHAADAHLDSPMKGLAAYPGAPVEELRLATRAAFENLVELCISTRADFLLLAGDLYDGDWRHFGTGLYLQSQLVRLREAGIPVIAIRGNHDADSVITKRLSLPSNVTVLDHAQPQTKVIDELGVAIHGQSFATRAVTDNLAAAYPQAHADAYNIGLLHSCVGGYAEHERYAPCSLDDLLLLGYDYLALGHIHERAVLHEDPWVVFPGNLQGRHARERGPKGATVVTVEEGNTTVEHRSLDHARWELCEIDASPAAGEADILDLVDAGLAAALAGGDDRLLACRVRISGRTAAHGLLAAEAERLDNEIRARANDVGSGRLWVERVQFATVADERGAPDDAADVLAELLRGIRGAAASPQALEHLADELRPFAAKLPAEIRRGADPFDPTDPATLKAALLDVERILPSLVIGARSR